MKQHTVLIRVLVEADSEGEAIHWAGLAAEKLPFAAGLRILDYEVAGVERGHVWEEGE
ncbi:MAG: hypothetical protein Q8R28_04570 [Dehalococcoidia bacterium]|nr:hypothetical protein [Dehalococcoidia bacterium]